MKPKINTIKRSRKAWSPYNPPIRIFILSLLILTGLYAPLQAQDVQYTKPSWYFGVAAGANFNFYRGSTQMLNTALTVPTRFQDGNGVGLYLAPLLEFHRPDTKLGFMLQAGYDSRKGKFKEIETPCNCPADLSTDLSYITIEPSLRFAPFRSGFYLFAGPRLAFNMTKSFTYKLGINPAYPAQAPTPDVKADFSDINKTQFSMQVGAGLDIPLSSRTSNTQFVLSPFVSFHPYFGQSPRTIETWNITTIRAGIALKLGRGHLIVTPKKDTVITPVPVAAPEPEVKFSVSAPKNVPVQRRVRETFPLRDYVFFDLGSTEIPARYVLLKKDQVKDFREDKLVPYAPEDMSGRSERQMVVYYNILNILGDRMVKNPSTTIKLVGSSEKGPKDGREMAESIKRYLVEVYGIDPTRIRTEGRKKPIISSEQPGGTKELSLLREGDRRVTIVSSSPLLLMEFQNGPDAQMKQSETPAVQEAPPESYVSFDNEGQKEAFTSWSLELRDDKGTVQNFGPYTDEKISIPTKSILGNKPEGDYNVTMVGQTKSGTTVKKEFPAHIVLWTPPKDEEMTRFSIIYEFNKSKATPIYEKYLLDVVTPKIPVGGTVILNGHTDNIGEESYNQKLSLARANDARKIIEKGLKKAGRKDVKFEVYGNGEDLNKAPFQNKFPEERFYNRTVIVDLISQK